MRAKKHWNNTKLFSLLSLFAIVLFMMLLQGCDLFTGSSSTPAPPAPPANQDPSGVYTQNGTGKATFVNFNGGAEIDLPDVKGMIQSGRFIFFDKSTNMVVDGNITTALRVISGTATVYYQGNMIANNVNVNGTVDGRANIELLLGANGGFSGGTILGLFSVSFYDRAALDSRIDTVPNRDWGFGIQRDVVMVNPGMTTSSFDMREADDSYRYVTNDGTVSIACAVNGTVSVFNANKNIYTLADEFTLNLDCTTLSGTTGYTGFASVVDSATTIDDTLWYAVTNGTYSVFAILSK